MSADRPTRSDPPPIRVALGEDNFLAREGITRVIDGLDGIELAAVCADLESLRAEIERTAPDVVVTDIRMPPDHTDEGIRLAEELRATRPRVGVVVLSQHVEPLYATALFAGGSYRRAYLLKERLTNPAELRRAIEEVAAGGALVDPRIVDELISEQRPNSPLQALTPREAEILALIAEGDANSAIAERLGITKRGVERHVNSIFAKLGLVEAHHVSKRVKAALVYNERQGRRRGESG